MFLRARHLPFEITQKGVECWLCCMKEIFVEVGLDSILPTPLGKEISNKLF
ncbi:hypothetical protein [Robertmurraya sp. P23]|uniref:globin domain-containing protein n=1 Tax=Robertmurraya sp. P23 TaxID=3436931 RepID=UPI003D986465